MSTLTETGDTSAPAGADASPTLAPPEWRYRRTVLYRAVNAVNGKAYVGITVKSIQSRRRNHLTEARGGSNSAFHRAIRKYGADAFQWSVLAYASCFAGAVVLEKLAIWAGLGSYNMTTGGDGAVGHRFSAESRAKMSNAAKGRLPWNTGKKLSAEQCAQISARQRGKPGRKLSDAERANLRACHLGRSPSLTVRQKISQSLKGRPGKKHTAETKAKISATKRRKYGADVNQD